jgi:hypothetical protein
MKVFKSYNDDLEGYFYNSPVQSTNEADLRCCLDCCSLVLKAVQNPQYEHLLGEALAMDDHSYPAARCINASPPWSTNGLDL